MPQWLAEFTDQNLSFDRPTQLTPWAPAGFGAVVVRWYRQYGRKNLPWQQQVSPYRVWVSEIMLQQTQVAVVIPYFLRFMERFPDLASLAGAEQDDVLRYWSGLGYYARARNLHQCAQRIQSQFGGCFPQDIKLLSSLPGIGRSTAGAILSFAFCRPETILDGNVKRVLTRCFAVPGWPGQANVLVKLWKLASLLTAAVAEQEPAADRRVADYNQAMMDLGATVCTRANPSCNRCPLAAHCIAHATDRVKLYPAARRRHSAPTKTRKWLLIRDQAGQVLLEQRPPTGIWGGLWAFPELQLDESTQEWCSLHLRVLVDKVEKLPERRHSFSHFDLDIRAEAVELAHPIFQIADADRHAWFDLETAMSLALPAPVKRLLNDTMSAPSEAAAGTD